MLPRVILRRGSSHIMLLIHLALQAIIWVKLKPSLSHTSLHNPKTKPNQPSPLCPQKGARKPENVPPEQELHKSSLKRESWQTSTPRSSTLFREAQMVMLYYLFTPLLAKKQDEQECLQYKEIGGNTLCELPITCPNQ